MVELQIEAERQDIATSGQLKFLLSAIPYINKVVGCFLGRYAVVGGIEMAFFRGGSIALDIRMVGGFD